MVIGDAVRGSPHRNCGVTSVLTELIDGFEVIGQRLSGYCQHGNTVATDGGGEHLVAEVYSSVVKLLLPLVNVVL